MSILKKTSAFVALLIATSTAYAQQTITQKINDSESISVVHSSEIEARLMPPADGSTAAPGEVVETRTVTRKAKGYRVLVFTDNNVKTARAEANSVAKEMAAVFPQYPVYVTYNTPNWRVKIGDFRTKKDALDVLAEIKKTLPEVTAEARVVQDGINIEQ